VEPINLTRLIRELTHLLTVSISKKAVLSCQLTEDLPAIEGDPVQVRQIAMNLVINASEAIGDHEGAITVSTRLLECDDAWIREHRPVETADAGRYVCLEVVDTGCGMDETIRARIFDPFYTTKFTGRGLGLAAVLGIVRKHRGMLIVASEPGDGTTFQVLFPVSEQSAAAGPSAAKEEPPQGSGTILLVDDEAPVRKVATRMLERYGFTVLSAADGLAALEVFRQHPDEIACVVLDLSMPRMDGRETLRKLREIRPRVRVLLASGYSDADVMQQFAGEGPGGFIEKPYQMDTFMAKLRSVLEADPTSDGRS
jgi:two-component system, cell cycle sensor histidine kinase and response regulator CckA